MDTGRLKQKLQDERNTIETELMKLGRKNPDREGDFEATAGDFDAQSPEPEEQAQKFQEEENNKAVLTSLEARLADVSAALERLAQGTYGRCAVCSKEIEIERLEINPAAITCTEHLHG